MWHLGHALCQASMAHVPSCLFAGRRGRAAAWPLAAQSPTLQLKGSSHKITPDSSAQRLPCTPLLPATKTCAFWVPRPWVVPRCGHHIHTCGHHCWLSSPGDLSPKNHLPALRREQWNESWVCSRVRSRVLFLLSLLGACLPQLPAHPGLRFGGEIIQGSSGSSWDGQTWRLAQPLPKCEHRVGLWAPPGFLPWCAPPNTGFCPRKGWPAGSCPRVGRDSPGCNNIRLSLRAKPLSVVRVHPRTAGDEPECQNSASFQMLKIRLSVLSPPSPTRFSEGTTL